MLLFRGPQWDKGLSADELKEAMTNVMAWFGGLHERGKVKGAQPLGTEGRTISGTNGHLVVDGPFTETKEIVGGYAILETKTKEEAIEATKRFLMVHGDAWELECEVRQIEEPAFEGSPSCNA